MDFEQMINAMRDKLDDATKGKVSEDLIAILGEYRSQKQTLEDAQASNKKLTADNEELLKTNGRLFQQIGFNNTQDKVTFNGEEPSKKEPTLKIEDIIDSKGNIIKKVAATRRMIKRLMPRMEENIYMSTRGVDVFNVVRQVSSDRFQEIVPSAAESNILELKNILFNEAYKPQLNEFVTNLINRIGLTIVRNKSYSNPLAMFKKGAVPLGTDIQDIYTNPAKAEEYVLDDAAAAQLLRISTPDTKAAYYRRNRQDRYVKTIARQTLQAAFDSWDKFEDFIVSISQSLYSGAYIDEFKLTKDLIQGAYANGKIITEVISDPTASEANAKAMIKKVRALYTKMQAPSSKYNAYSVMGNADTPVVTWTDSSRVVFITTAEVMASVDVDVLAAAFNMSHADFVGRVVVVDSFDDADIYGILCDEAWLQIYDNLMQFDEFYNASVMAWNEYLHVWGTFAICPFANAVCLAKEKAIPATAITIAEQTVNKGSSKTVTATLTPTNSTTGLSNAYSADERIATVELVDGSIKLKGVDAGSTTGHVVTENGLTAQFKITVS